MMVKPTLDDLSKSAENRYALVQGIVKRTVVLSGEKNGIIPDVIPPMNAVKQALEDIASGIIKIETGAAEKKKRSKREKTKEKEKEKE